MRTEPELGHLEGRSLMELERLASAGGPSAITALASRLMVDAPQGSEQIIGLLSEATSLGDAEAPRLGATLAALGLWCRQSWETAFNLLAVASERGDTIAQSQLRFLAGAEDDEEHWSALPSRIQLPTWLEVPDRNAICERPRIRTVKMFAPPALCDWLISYARPRLAPAKVIRRDRTDEMADHARTNRALVIDPVTSNVVIALLQHRIAKVLHVPVVALEAPQVLNYRVGEEFKPHLDYVSGGQDVGPVREVRRVLTFLLYLNDKYEGGETHFGRIGLHHKGSQGDALTFANVTIAGEVDPLALHAGLSPLTGEKWIFSQWIHDRALW